MTTASTPKGRKNTIEASSSAMRYAPHQVRKNAKNRTLPADAVVLRVHLAEIEWDADEIDDDLIRSAAGHRLGELRRRVPDDDHVRLFDDLVDRLAQVP